MSVSIGIVGLPNVGKSTLFQAITKKQVDCSNYPFCTIDPNIGVVAVPDERLDKLEKLLNYSKKVYAIVEFIDIAGLVKGASKGEGLGNKFLANIREVDVVLYILRCFKNDKVINTQSRIDVLNDKEILDTEMILKDLATVEKRICVLEKEARSRNKEAIKKLEILKKAQDVLQKRNLLTENSWNEEAREMLKGYQLLTLKKRLHLLNGGDGEISPEVIQKFKENKWLFLIADILTESEALEIDPKERESFGLSSELKIETLIKECYKLLGLITFFTTGKDELRAWTIKKGDRAPQAGGVVHSDFEKNFIKAEVINWRDLLDAGGFAEARSKGLIRTEGKDYIIKDGDVIEIKSGV